MLTTIPFHILFLLGINAFTFVAFWADKRAAIRNASRIPESILLVLCLWGGSAGGYLAMRLFRHKTQKQPFRIRFWGIVFLQVIFVGWFAFSSY